MTEDSASTERSTGRSGGRPTGRPPSPPWYGGLAIALIFLVAVVLLTYTLADLGWQQRLGPWVNYGSVVALIVLSSAMMRAWRPTTD